MKRAGLSVGRKSISSRADKLIFRYAHLVDKNNKSILFFELLYFKSVMNLL